MCKDELANKWCQIFRLKYINDVLYSLVVMEKCLATLQVETWSAIHSHGETSYVVPLKTQMQLSFHWKIFKWFTLVPYHCV